MWGQTFKQFDYQKECPDSEICDAGSISASLVGEDFYRRRNPARVTDKPKVIPGQKSAWKKRGAVECRVSGRFREARFGLTSV
jgi:hypothetical protein